MVVLFLAFLCFANGQNATDANGCYVYNGVIICNFSTTTDVGTTVSIIDPNDPNCTVLYGAINCNTIPGSTTTSTTTTTTTPGTPLVINYRAIAAVTVIGGGSYFGWKYWYWILDWLNSIQLQRTTTTMAPTTTTARPRNWVDQAEQVGLDLFLAELYRRALNLILDLLADTEISLPTTAIPVTTTTVAATTRTTTTTTIATTRSDTTEYYLFSPGSINLDQCANGAETKRIIVSKIVGNEVYDLDIEFNLECENCVANMFTSYDRNVLILEIALVSYENQPKLVVSAPNCPVCVISKININIIDDLCDTPQARTFMESLAAPYLDKFNYARVKMQFQANYSPKVSLEQAKQKLVSSCYNKIGNDDMIDCKVVQASTLNGTSNPNRRRRNAEDENSYYLTVVAKFKNQMTMENKSIISALVIEDAEEDNEILEIVQFVTFENDPISFILQIVFLSISLIIATIATISRVHQYYQMSKEEKSLKELWFVLIFDFWWPIAGIYPMIFVWYEYRTDDKLIYDPYEWVIGLLLYLSVMKLVVFIARLFCIESQARKVGWTENWPVFLELMVDYDIVNFIFCDALELLVAYFFVSRFMQPETEVSIANFWFPLFQFGMSFVPGIARISMGTYRWTKKKRKNKTKQAEKAKKGKESSTERHERKENKFKFIIGICTETIEITVLILTLLLFICSLGVTLCVPDTISFDSRLHATINGTQENRQSRLALEKEKIEKPGLCDTLPDAWFGKIDRFDYHCVHVLESEDRPLSTVSIMGSCSNPLEYIVIIAIILAIVLQIVILVVFVTVRYGQNIQSTVKRDEVYVNKSKNERKYEMSMSVAKPNQILDQVVTDGNYVAKKIW